MKCKRIVMILLVVSLLSACSKEKTADMKDVSLDTLEEKELMEVESNSVGNTIEKVSQGNYVLNTDNYDEDFFDKLKVKSDYNYKSNIDSHIIAIPVESYKEGMIVATYNNPANEGMSWYLSEGGSLCIEGRDGIESIEEWDYESDISLYLANEYLHFDRSNSINECALEEILSTDVYRFSTESSDGSVTWKYYTIANKQSNDRYNEIVTAVLQLEHDKYGETEREDIAKNVFSKISWYYVKDNDLTTATNMITNSQDDISDYALLTEVLCDRLGDFGLKIDSPECITQLDYGEVNLRSEKFSHTFYLSYFGDDVDQIESYIKNYDYYGNIEGIDFFVHKNDSQEIRAFYKDKIVWYTVNWNLDKSMPVEEAISHFFEVYR